MKRKRWRKASYIISLFRPRAPPPPGLVPINNGRGVYARTHAQVVETERIERRADWKSDEKEKNEIIERILPRIALLTVAPRS